MRVPSPGLSEVSRAVVVFDETIRDLATQMIEIMYQSPGCVGLAANQVGRDESLFVLDVSRHKKTTSHHGLLVVVNPTIVNREGQLTMREGCMSVPDLTGDVTRAESLTLIGCDLAGKSVEIESSGFEARAIQHEVDHLGGYLFIDRVSGSSKLHSRKRYL